MPEAAPTLDLTSDAALLTAALVDIPSVSGDEQPITDAVAAALARYPNLQIIRDGNVLIARTNLGLPQRIVLAGHLDTVPVAQNLPSRLVDGMLYGCGTSDMKAGVALALRAAHAVGSGTLLPWCELTWVFYDCEEIEAVRNGLGRVARERRELLAGDFAILFEPTNGVVEGGCQGTIRAEVRVGGRRAHSARSWLGENAIHAAAGILQRIPKAPVRQVEVDGLTYREGLNAVGIRGGVAGNVIPDECVVTVNYRFAPDLSQEWAQERLREVFAGFEVTITDSAPAARPGLDGVIAQRLVRAVGGEPAAKLGWTDVALFGELGIPAVNFGPGDPNLAHTQQEHVQVQAILDAEPALLRFLAAT